MSASADNSAGSQSQNQSQKLPSHQSKPQIPSQPRDLVDATFAAVREAAAQRGCAPPLGTSQTGAQSYLRRRRQARTHQERNAQNTPGSLSALNWQKYRQSGPDGRRPRRQLNLPSAGAVLNKEITSRGWEKNLASGWVTGHWEQLVGEKIAQHTKVEMVKDTALFISCDSTAWATNLRYMQREILRSIREKAGPDVITELKIFGPQAPNWRKGKLHVKGRGPRDTYG